MSSNNKQSPKRFLARPRPSAGNRINTASSPNLAGSFNTLQISGLHLQAKALPRKTSLSALTSSHLATVPDASKGYGLSTVFDEDSPASRTMPPFTPTRGNDGDELEVGDMVDVPGDMHGTVKFIGSVQGKKGVFAGVELSHEFAMRGKNSGDVDG